MPANLVYAARRPRREGDAEAAATVDVYATWRGYRLSDSLLANIERDAIAICVRDARPIDRLVVDPISGPIVVPVIEGFDAAALEPGKPGERVAGAPYLFPLDVLRRVFAGGPRS